MVNRTAIDRRILGAFYTQYVALLLMLLVFWIGVVYAASPQQVRQLQVADRILPIGSLDYPDFFKAAESAEINSQGGIEAVLEVLQSHDLSGVFTIAVPISGNRQVAATTAYLRARALKMRAAQGGLPAQAIKIIAVPSKKPSTAVHLSFESLEAANAES